MDVTLKLDTVNAILAVLSELPYRVSAQTIQILMAEVSPQVQGNQTAAQEQAA